MAELLSAFYVRDMYYGIATVTARSTTTKMAGDDESIAEDIACFRL